MNCFVDTNVLVAVVTAEDGRAEAAVTVLNDHEAYTSVLNLMELRSVLSKKKRFERDRIEAIEDRIVDHATISVLDASDVLAANPLQRETISTRWMH